MVRQLSAVLHARSVVLAHNLEHGFPRILTAWLLLCGLACAVRVANAPLPITHVHAAALAPYFLLITAPFASALLAFRWFADGDRMPQPRTRLAIVGEWAPVSRQTAHAHALYGTTGLMMSLLIGVLLNVPVRAAEYLAAVAPMPQAAPVWLRTLQAAMTFDAVLFTSLYAIAFVAALRRVPLFPRLLGAIWLADLAMQLVMANVIGSAPGLPYAVGSAVNGLLYGNVQKVLISVVLWLPYLLLSERVNVTFRSRIPA